MNEENVQNKRGRIGILILLMCILCLIVGICGVNTKSKVKGVKSFNPVGSKIALIKLEGVIDSEDSSSPWDSQSFTAQNAIASIKQAQKDNSVKGVLLEINSPGGTVAASQNLYQAVLRLREKKPVVVIMDDVAASGGYYVASAADRIVAQKGTLTGSIGVIFSTLDIHNLLNQKLSITSNVIKSGKYKDIGSNLKAMTPDERELLQVIIDDSYQQFIKAIEDGRINRVDTFPLDKKILTKETLLKYADGRIFTGNQAYKLGFVDALGDEETAHKIVKTLAVEKFKLMNEELPIVLFSKGSLFSDLFMSFSENQSKNNFLKNLVPVSTQYGRTPMYLWE